MGIEKKLFSYKKKRIALEELMHMAGNRTYDGFVELVNRCVSDKILEPVKASRTNGRRPALYNKYRILKPEEDYTYALEAIKMLHPSFNHSKYARQPEVYVKYKREIDLLSQFLWHHDEALKETMSINERSFQIWGKEKLLKNRSVVKSIFQFNDWGLDLLNYFETPEPFFEYIFSNEKHMNILIIENKDTWFSLRKIMLEDRGNYLFRPYHVLLYGEGKKIIRRNGRLKEYDQFLEGSKNKYYYFGDLDYEGIEIYQTLVQHNGDMTINLCTELYRWMLRGSRQYDLPTTKLGQKKVDIEGFLKNFTKDEAREMEGILEGGYYIPQETLNYPLLKMKMMEGLKK